MKHAISKATNSISTWAGSVSAVVLSVASLILFLILGFVFHFSFLYQIIINTIMSSVSYILLFMIQHVQNRDAIATQIKLDAIIESIKKADNCLINVEALSEEQLSAIRERYKEIGQNSREDFGFTNQTLS